MYICNYRRLVLVLVLATRQQAMHSLQQLDDRSQITAKVKYVTSRKSQEGATMHKIINDVVNIVWITTRTSPRSSATFSLMS